MLILEPIQKAFEFSDSDVEANARGQLTDGQIETLRRNARRLALPIAAIIIVLGILVWLTTRDTMENPIWLLLGIGIPLILTLALTIGTVESAIAPRTVAQVDGQVHRSYGMMPYDPPLDEKQSHRQARFGMGGSYRMIVGDKRFTLTREQYEALGPYQYIVHYLPSLNKIVSMQLVKLPSTTAPLNAIPASAADPISTAFDIENNDLSIS